MFLSNGGKGKNQTETKEQTAPETIQPEKFGINHKK
jgi:hypothetical protein